MANDGGGHGGEEFLQVGVARADDVEALRGARFDFADGVDQARHVDEGVAGGLVAIAGREGGGALEVGSVVGGASGGVEDFDAQLSAEGDEGEGFGEINLRWVLLVNPEGVAIGQAGGVVLRDAGAEFAGL